MKFKDGIDPAELDEVTPKMRGVLAACAAWSLYYTGIEIVITSILRREDTGSPHAYGRAVDVRTSHYRGTEIVRLCDFLNFCFPRSDTRPTALYHDVGQGAYIHLQVQA